MPLPYRASAVGGVPPNLQSARRSMSAATDAIGAYHFDGGLYGLQVPSRDCHVGLWPPRNDKPLAFTVYRQPALVGSIAPGPAVPAPTIRNRFCAGHSRFLLHYTTWHENPQPALCKKTPRPKRDGAAIFLWQHRSIQREHSARDFLSRQGLKSAGVLCVRQTFRTDGSAKNIRRRPKLQWCGVAPYITAPRCGRARRRRSAQGTAGAGGSGGS